MKSLKNRMEQLREESNKLIEHGDKEQLLKISRELDVVICEYIKMESSK